MNGSKQPAPIAFVTEAAKQTPVVCEVDLCVIGGSCTGVFAAVRAARLGLTVALVEQGVIFGGSATQAQVNEWHSLADMRGQNRIIGGLTCEVLERLRRRDAIIETRPGLADTRYRFNSAELATELDGLVTEHPAIRIFLAARCVGGLGPVADGRLDAALIEDKSGRRAIVAKFFIDASGDGDLLRRAGIACWRNDALQPVSYQQLVAGMEAFAVGRGGHIDRTWPAVADLAEAFSYPGRNAKPWFFDYPSPADVCNVFGARLNNVDASVAEELTAALIEGRRCQRAVLDMIRHRSGRPGAVAALSHPHAIGVRETWHARCLHRLRAEELLYGKKFDDTIAVGTYPVDVHSPEGTLLRYLDGVEHLVDLSGEKSVRTWRDTTDGFPDFYCIPLRSLIPEGAQNLLVAGRLLDADKEAFGGVRVMVNMNQTGEAAGVAAALCVNQGLRLAEIPVGLLRETLFPERLF